MRRAPNDETLAAARAQRWAAFTRAAGRCEFEIRAGGEWVRCPRRGQEAAHAPYPRRDCAKAREHPDVVLWACRTCHQAHDEPLLVKATTVRVPPAQEEAAWQIIGAHSKVLPSRRLPPA